MQKLLETTRLLTLTGAGGCGKTRLALQTAAQVASEFGDGVYWCDLASLSDPSYVAQTVARVLGSAEQPDRSALEAVIESIGTQQMLLILDNCEHVLEACAALASATLAACPHVKILATSQQSFGLPQEYAWQVPPLALPNANGSLDALSQCDAIRLFIARAAEAFPGFALDEKNAPLVAAICQRLDGLPLAIELAAARVKVLSPAQIVERLDDSFQLLTRGRFDTLPRHQTLRATMDWSYQLLSEDEQVLLRSLSVFAGSFTLDMVEATCAEKDEGGKMRAEVGERHTFNQVLDVLSDLVDKSLVSIHSHDTEGAARFRLLETVRQYAREKLEVSGEAAAIRTRLLEWAVHFAEEMQPRLAGPKVGATLARLALEEDNLRAALQWVRMGRDVERGLRLAAALWDYWLNRGALTEGRRWLEELLAMEPAQGTVSPTVRAKALYAAARLAFRQSDPARANTLAEASLNAAREVNDPAALATPLNLLAILATERGELARAATMHEQALAIHRQMNDLNRAGSSLINLGIIERRRGELKRAASLYQEALTIKRQFGDTSLIALTLLNLGENAVWQGDYPRAAALLEESLMLYRELGNRTQIATALNNLSAAVRYQGDRARARALLEQALALHQEVGDKLRVNVVRINLGDLARDEGDWVRAQSIYADALAQLRQVVDPATSARAGDPWSVALALYSLGLVSSHLRDDTQALTLYTESLRLYHSVGFLVGIGMIEVLEALCEIYSSRGDWVRAARALHVAATRRAASGAPIPPPDRRRYEETMQFLRSALGAAAYAAMESDARTLTIEQVVAEVLGEPRALRGAAPVTVQPPALRVFALGATRVVVGKRVLHPADWKYTKSKELFFYFLANPPTTKAQIGLDLWPDASPDQLRNILHRVMHYMRKALGHPQWILFDEDTYTFDRHINFWCDLNEFEARLKEAQSLLKSGLPPAARPRAIERLEAAAQLWRGDFLEDMDAGEWAIFRRENLRQSFLQALLDLGQLYLAEARYADAVEAFQRALSLDNYLEVAHRELMRAYARQGDAARAVRHFNEWRHLMREELSAEPSAETLLLYDRLRRGDDV